MPLESLLALFTTCLLILATTTTTTTSAQEDLTCHLPGKCSGVFVDTSNADSYNTCLDRCKSNAYCKWMTHYHDSGDCVLMNTCPDVEEDPNCFSAAVDCPPFQTGTCNAVGVCHGVFVEASSTENVEECLRFCQSVPQCRWYTFFTESGNCILTEDCELFDDSCETCLSGERDCQLQTGTWTKLMIVSAFPAPFENDVEIVDLALSPGACQDPDDTPGYRGKVGAFFAGRPMVCGGGAEITENQCNRLNDGNGWDPAAPMRVARYLAAGVLVDDDTWWVTGGYDGEYINSTERITAGGGGWSDYVDLPKADCSHCLLKVNDTHFFLAGGENQANFAYLFDTDSGLWTRLADASEERGLPTCGVITRDDGSKEIVFAGGYRGLGQSGTSEIFSLSSLTWRAGPDLPQPMDSAFAVQDGPTFLAVGGFSNGALYDTILRYDQVNDLWEVLPQRLGDPKAVFSAFLVPDESVDCS